MNSGSAPTEISHAPHPLSRPIVFEVSYPAPLGELETPEAWAPWRQVQGAAPVRRDEAIRKGVRDLLRHGGHKPTGRGKPASEYLLKAATDGALAEINVAVDAGNIVSLHSGFPISIVDTECAAAPFGIAIPEAGSRYVFNPSGQEISVAGLLSLFDSEGPCANGVKDSQRTKTSAETRKTLNVIWGCTGFEEEAVAAKVWFDELLTEVGARIAECVVVVRGDES